MRAVQDVHTHDSHRIVPRKATGGRTVGQQVKETKRIARTVQLVAGVTGKVEAEGPVVVQDGRVDRAVHEGEYGVRRRRNNGGLYIRHNEVVMGLQDCTRGHCRIVDHHGLLVVVDGLDFVGTGWSLEEEVGVVAS